MGVFLFGPLAEIGKVFFLSLKVEVGGSLSIYCLSTYIPI